MRSDAISLLGTWHDGSESPADAPSWDAVAAEFLGCGYRVSFPHRPGFEVPLEHAEGWAQRVAGMFGARWDLSAWAALRGRLRRAGGGWTGVTVVGGWPYDLDRSFGAPWTRAHTGFAIGTGVRPVRAITLPWARNTQSATAALPLISGLAEARAWALLGSRGADVGLWTDHHGEVVTGTAGTLLLHLDGGWTTPRADVPAGASWPWVALCEALSVPAAPVTPAEVLAARCVAFVSPLGDLEVATSLDGRPLRLDDAPRDELVAVRERLLPGLSR